jgi:hypothetical protein
MKTICLACVIYTLTDTDPSQNLYINIFYQWLAMLIKNGGLTKDDMLHIYMDDETIKYLNTTKTVFHDIIPKLPCDFEIIEFKQPETHLQGKMNKYAMNEYSQDIYLYCDINHKIVNSLHSIDSILNENSMYFFTISLLNNTDFEISKLPQAPAFSSSIFIIVGKELRDTFFNRINALCDYTTTYSSVDEPFFNKAIYEIPRDVVSININLLGEYIRPDTSLIHSKIIFNYIISDHGIFDSFIKISDTLSFELIR